MKIALINENSQADKNSLINKILCNVTTEYGYEVINFGKYSSQENRNLPYTDIGLLASILLATKTVDFVVTGCGTGQGAAISCNSFPNIVCGIVSSPLDGYLFTQINAGNAISIPYAEKFGWGSELELEQIFHECFKSKFGQGYPEKFAESQAKSRNNLEEQIKKVICDDMLLLLKKFDKERLQSILEFPQFKETLEKNAEDNEVTKYIKSILK